MLLRLSFAIATLRQPEILLLDEVIGVGDAEFMKKARARLAKIASRASILVLASHSDEIIRLFCTKAMWLTQGTVGAFGEVDAVLSAYHSA